MPSPGNHDSRRDFPAKTENMELISEFPAKKIRWDFYREGWARQDPPAAPGGREGGKEERGERHRCRRSEPAGAEREREREGRTGQDGTRDERKGAPRETMAF